MNEDEKLDQIKVRFEDIDESDLMDGDEFFAALADGQFDEQDEL